MKKGNPWYYTIYVLITVMICIFPIYGSLIDGNYKLKGVASTGERITIDFRSLWEGTTQRTIENRLMEKVPGRTALIRAHSQLLYSLFNSSSNSNVVIGSNHSLYEPEYLCDFLNLWPLMSEESQDELITKLIAVQDLLTQKGKKLYIFITPSKVRYDYENIPWFYRAFTKPEMRKNYDRFISNLRASSISYFDSINYINENMSDSTIFYSSGIHWGNGAAAEITKAMLEDMKKDIGYDLGSLIINLSKSENGMEPDQDLLSILNLYFYSKEDEYRIPEYTYIPGGDRPNVLMRGGSFMGQSLYKLIELDVFDRSAYFQNNLVITDKTDSQILSDFNAYLETDVGHMVDVADLVILEVNEEKIWTMSWGFIDELINTLQDNSEETRIQLIGQRNISTVENPWGVNIGYINYHDKEGILLTSSLDTKVKFNTLGGENSLSFDVEIHEWVKEHSDGCILLAELLGNEYVECEYFLQGGEGENKTLHVTIPVKEVEQVTLSYYNPEGMDQDCDWVVISNINIE